MSAWQLAGIRPELVYDASGDHNLASPASVTLQRTAYALAKAVFDFCPHPFDLDASVRSWHERNIANIAGNVPELFTLETRVGAALSLLGYLSNMPPQSQQSDPGLTTVLASSGTLKIMEPVLKQHLAEFSQHNVPIHVAAVDYDVGSGRLVNDVASPLRVARNLSVPAFVSTLVKPADVAHTALLTAAAAKIGPAIHVWDGIRGNRQVVPQITLPKGAMNELLKTPIESLDHAFEVTNRILGTNLQAFEYSGPAQPEVVVVSLGAPAANALVGDKIGSIHVRLYNPFLSDEFLAALPATAARIVVLGHDLAKDVAAAVSFHFGFGNGPRVERVSEWPETPSSLAEALNLPQAPIVNSSEFSQSSEKATGIKVWARDNSPVATAAASVAQSHPNSSIYTVFDNLVEGGVVQTDLQVDTKAQGNVEYWPLEGGRHVGFVSDPRLLEAYDIASALAPGSALVVVSDSGVDIPQSLSARKDLKLYRLVMSRIDSQGTEGRTEAFAAQAVLSTLSEPALDADAITRRLLAAAGAETELVAVAVNRLVRTVQDVALTPLDGVQHIETVTADGKDASLQASEAYSDVLAGPLPTSFFPVDHSVATNPTAEEVNDAALAQRLAFVEAFNEETVLRPEVTAKTSIARVKLNERVTPSDYDRHIFHLELDIAGTGLKYGIGEALGIHAPNDVASVTEFITWYGLNAEEVIAVPHRDDAAVMETKTVFQVLRDNLDLFGKVPKRFYEGLAPWARDPKQRNRLERLCGPAGAAELRRRADEDFETYVDVLREFDSAHPPLTALIELVSPLKRREYSIASSQKVHPNEVHLLVVVVDWVSKRTGEKRFGQCSKFLSDLRPGAEVVVSVKPSVMKLPQDPSKPIVMAGLGTGLAPFKAFLEEKLWQRQHGHDIGEVYLFLGSRHQRQEYLYGELFEAYKAAGILTHIGAAFSRDQAQKVYIQHRIREASAQLTEAFVRKGGTFYLCGPTWPVPDVSSALADIVASEAAERNETIDDVQLIEDLKEAERYILEVY